MAKLIPAVTLAVWLTGLGSLHAQETMSRPLGKWERKIGKNQVSLVVEEGRLHITVQGEKPCILHADYSMTRDQIVYGVITSVEYDPDDDNSGEKMLIDAPFSCRFRIDEGVLIVRDLKCAGDVKDDTWGGRFKAVAPAPHPVTASNSAPTAASFATPVLPISSQPTRLTPQTAAPAPSLVPTIRPVAVPMPNR